MSEYKTATHQNLSVWARRLGMEIQDLDKGAAYADSLFGYQSRRSCLAALAILYVAKLNGLPMNDTGMMRVGIAMGNILYDRVYGDRKYDNLALAFREEMMASVLGGHITHNEAADLIMAHHALALDFVGRGIASRDGERSRPSLANLIMGKVRL